MESPVVSRGDNSAQWRMLKEYGPPLLLGCLAFFIVLGGGILAPTNIAWLNHFDPATSYLGWSFFRQSPWQLPPGANPLYGLDLTSSIYYSDTIPLVSLVGKLFSPWLPDAFQYWGLWLLLCFVLQSLFGWKLAGLLTRLPGLRLLATGLFLFSPPFLFRLNFHYALSSQWLVLAALYLCLGPPRPLRYLLWSGLGFLAAGIHSYLFAMIAVLWLADAARRLFIREISLFAGAKEAAFFLVASLTSLWLTGFFVVSKGLESWGLGDAHMNLLSLINPVNYPEGGNWSYLLPPLTVEGFDFEGFNYLGLGILFLIVIAVIVACSGKTSWQMKREWLPLCLVLLGLAVFAISNRVSLGHFVVATYPLPDICKMLRCTGRMFWPVFYTGLFLLLRFLFQRLEKRQVVWVIGLALVLQVLDTSAGWGYVHRHKNLAYGSTWPSPLQSDFWSQAGSRYQRLYLIPFQDYPDSPYQTFAYYALNHHMGTDAVYLARVDPDKLARHQQKLDADLTSGNFDTGALYILDAPHAALAAKSLKPDRDFMETIDGYTVLAPGWKSPR